MTGLDTEGVGTMRHSRTLRLSAILAVSAAVAVTLAGAAAAGRLFSDTFHEEDTVVVEDFCGAPGLTVEVSSVVDGRVQAVDRSQGGAPPYFLEDVKRTDVYRNPANGTSMTEVVKVVQKDLHITDNGDGTITIVVLATGNAVLYGQDGKAVARDPGQIRFALLVDTAGTPSDPSDDEELAFLGVVKESTGRGDDFCGASVPALS